MHVETTTRIADGELSVTVNPGTEKPFATIDLDFYSYIRLKSLDDCDRLIRAAVNAKRRFEAATAGTPHPYAQDADLRSNCDTCGLLAGHKIHAEPEPLLWKCAHCKTEYEAAPSYAPPVCPVCGPPSAAKAYAAPAPSGMQSPAPVVRVISDEAAQQVTA